MSETKPRPLRLDDEVLAAINALPGRSVNDKLRAALIDSEKPEKSISADPRVDELLDLVRSLPDGEDMRLIVDEVMTRKIEERRAAPTIPGVQRGYSGDFNHCVHCEQDYPRPAGQPPTSMCPTCRAAGHWNTGNCRPCAEAKHLASVASLDQTGAGRSDIVYDPQT